MQRSAADARAYAQTLLDEPPENVAAQVREMAEAVVSSWSGVAAEGALLLYQAQRPAPGGPAQVAKPSIGERLASGLSFALAPLFNPDGFDSPGREFLSRLGSQISLHVAAGDRETMLLNAGADKLPARVRRFARPGACAFCAYLSSVEAAVYDETVWHVDCTCVNVPGWEDNPIPDADYMSRFAQAAEDARAAILADYAEKRERMPHLRRGNFYKKFPKTAVNTKNIAARMRADLGLSH